MLLHIGMIPNSVDIDRIIALHRGRRWMLIETEFRQVLEYCNAVGVEDAILQDHGQHVDSHDAQALDVAVQQWLLVTTRHGRTQRLLSLIMPTSVAPQHNDDPDQLGNTSPNLIAAVTSPEEAQSLVALTEEMELGLLSPFESNYASQLQLWVYQISNERLTMAERLEKSRWEVKREVKRLERL